jgi:hypothetical protein
MNRFIYTFLAFALLASAPLLDHGQNADSTPAAQPVLENEYVRVTQADFQAGEKSSFAVPKGRLAVLVRLRLPKPGPHTEPDLSLQVDRVLFLDEGEEMSLGHLQDGSAFREVRIELKKDPPASLFEKDAVKLDPGHNILVYENDHVRVVQVHFPRGEQGPVVDKRPRVIILLTDMHAQVVKPGGTPEPRDGTAGTIQWSLGGSQATINRHESYLENVVVELKGR